MANKIKTFEKNILDELNIKAVEYIDDMNTFLESTIHECGRILYDYKNEVRQAKQKFFFEGVEEEPLLEAANDNSFLISVF